MPSDSSKEFRRNNHYVHEGYLKRWQSTDKKILIYRTLVSHEKVPLWGSKSLKSAATQQHLYTRIVERLENDAIERWFDKEYESAVEAPITKVVKNQRLSPYDWEALIRFYAMQDVRTPKQFLEHKKRMNCSLPKILKEVLESLPDRLKEQQTGKEWPEKSYGSYEDMFPVTANIETDSNKKTVSVDVKATIGRASWLFSIKRLLAEPAQILHSHKWTIMRPANGYFWPTSDAPAIKLNYYDYNKYDFLGGWNKKGTNLLMPLSPEHLLYAQVGHRPPQRNSRFSIVETEELQKIIAQHAHRMIFSKNPLQRIESLRPRVIDQVLYQNEKSQWERWHLEQSKSEEKNLRKVQLSKTLS